MGKAQCLPEIEDSENEWEDYWNAFDFMENLVII